MVKIEEVRAMNEMEISDIKTALLTKGGVKQWKAKIPNFIAKLTELEKQWWQIGADIEQTRKVLWCVKDMEEK